MQTPDPIEAALARLMPSAMSVSGQRSIEEMLDGLAGGVPVSPVHRFKRQLIGMAIAASIAGMVAIPVLWQPAHKTSPTVATVEPVAASEIVCLEDRDRVDSIDFEGRDSAANGSAMKIMRAHMVRERVVRVPEGYTMLISEPRDERVYVPVEAEESF